MQQMWSIDRIWNREARKWFFSPKKEDFFPNKGTISSSKGLDKYEVIEWDTADTAAQ